MKNMVRFKESWTSRRRGGSALATWLSMASRWFNGFTVIGGNFFFDGHNAILQIEEGLDWDFYPSLAGAVVTTNIGTLRFANRKIEIASASVTLTGSPEWVYAEAYRDGEIGSIQHSADEPMSNSTTFRYVIAKYTTSGTGLYSRSRLCLTDAQLDSPTR